MKRLFLCYLFLMVAIDIVAQHVDTPKKQVSGYVITNDNDTIHGTIDYISPSAGSCQKAKQPTECISPTTSGATVSWMTALFT